MWKETEIKRTFSLMIPTDELEFFSVGLPASCCLADGSTQSESPEKESQQNTYAITNFVKTSLNMRNNLFIDN